MMGLLVRVLLFFVSGVWVCVRGVHAFCGCVVRGGLGVWFAGRVGLVFAAGGVGVFVAGVPLRGVAQDSLAWVARVGAVTFPEGKRVVYANDFGAVGDGRSLNTRAIQRAIDVCGSKGGGTVLLKGGYYVTGSIFLKSHVQLRLDSGVVLLGSEQFNDYPEIDTRIAGIEMKWPAALINLIDVQDAAVSGKGTINARGRFCWDRYRAMRKDYDARGLRWIVDYDAKRVRTVLVQHSSDVTIQDITIMNAGFWTVQLLYGTRLTVRGVVIRNNEDGSGPSTDGIDVDSSTWVLIEGCDIDCNDDNFCLKAGRDWDGLRVNLPTAFVVIRKCVARRGAGLVTLGSETSGGIHHVLATELFARHTDNGLRIKSATTRGGTIEDIYFTNITMDSVTNVFQFNLNWYPAYSYSELPKGYVFDSIPGHWKAMLHRVEPAVRGIPHARDVFVRHVVVTNAKCAFVANGLEQSALEHFVFSDCRLETSAIGTMDFTQGWLFDNVLLDVHARQLALPNSTNMKFE